MTKGVVFGVVTVGLLIGLLTGLSNSPVVAAIIPLFFGVVGGATGFNLLRPRSEGTPIVARAATVGMLAGAFATSCIAGLSYGIATRSPIGWRALVPPTEEPLTKNFLSDHRGLSADAAVSVAILDRKLRAIGVPDEDVRQIVTSAAVDIQRSVNARPSVGQLRAGLLSLSNEMAAHAEAKGRPEALYMKWLRLGTIAQLVVPEGREIDELLTSAASLLTELRESDESLLWLASRSFDIKKIYRQEAILRDAVEGPRALWSSTGVIGHELKEMFEHVEPKSDRPTSDALFGRSPSRGLASNP